MSAQYPAMKWDQSIVSSAVRAIRLHLADEAHTDWWPCSDTTGYWWSRKRETIDAHHGFWLGDARARVETQRLTTAIHKVNHEVTGMSPDERAKVYNRTDWMYRQVDGLIRRLDIFRAA